ncbi:transmembrane amino acid transporter protein-domain-containing protein [Gigaspora margarita]|uniref:Transmembrane amino acid transporter protein-domain-containing protein n=1 Tax=Gigaspora margarita TaxID=4874 RepID=A0A8H4EMA1_GIGMA|nr:transmembrane amino acid transporter protein-domain-containing protein [Gigaspora margarita]
MISPAIAEPVEINKAPSNNVPDTHNRISNINRLASPPQGQNIQLSKSQPNFNKLGSSPNNKLHLSASGGFGRSFGSLEPNVPNVEAIPIDIPNERKVEIIRKHLVTGEDLARSAENSGSSADPLALYSTSHHKLPGLDATHEVYKWHNNIEIEPMKRTRSRSLYIPRPTDPDTSNIREPGGFRRHHLIMKARQEGKELPNIITRNFIDFLAMYGHFAGEDLSDDEEEDDDDEPNTELTPLIPRERGISTHATASPSKAVFLLLKSFVGTGVMFLPKAFFNGGMIFSTIVLIGIASISLFAFLLLVETRFYVPYSFGDIGGVLYGRWMRSAVLFSITISQIGFVCAYMIFVAENLSEVAGYFMNKTMDTSWFIVGQLFVFAPLAMIRRISRLSFTALIADAFIMFGLLYLYYYDIFRLSTKGVGEIILFNPRDFALFIGTAVFTFEGIGLIIPITESMKEPKKFPKVLIGVMIFVTIIFTSIGVLSYAAFGKDVKTVVILNLPSDDPIVRIVQLLYALAILLSVPLQLFPAIRIMEQGIFERSGKDNLLVKWQKNLFRFLTVVACGIIAWGGASDLDKFVSLIGSFACVPLCFLYPPLFHFKAAAHTLSAKCLDVLVFVFGLFSLLYTTYITLYRWSENS